MSVGPVSRIEASGPQLADTAQRDGSSPAPKTNVPRPDSGTSPKQEVSPAQEDGRSTPIPQDEVQVQREDGIDGEIVVKYLNQSGDVILQIPSSQVLGLARAIGQDLKKEARSRASADADDEGGESRGH